MDDKLSAAVALGKLGGKARSLAKTIACQRNAKRPRPNRGVAKNVGNKANKIQSDVSVQVRLSSRRVSEAATKKTAERQSDSHFKG
jgi:hypothetical protein